MPATNLKISGFSSGVKTMLSWLSGPSSSLPSCYAFVSLLNGSVGRNKMIWTIMTHRIQRLNQRMMRIGIHDGCAHKIGVQYSRLVDWHTVITRNQSERLVKSVCFKQGC